MIPALVMGLCPLSASADHSRDTAVQAHALYTAAQTAWQRDLADLVTRTNPDFREIATVQRDLQLAYIEQSGVRFKYLLEHDSKRIILTEGVSRFANFDWTDSDTKALEKMDSSYALLQEKVANLKKKNDQQTDWAKFREWFRETLSKSDAYKTLAGNLQAKNKEVMDLLGKYKP